MSEEENLNIEEESENIDGTLYIDIEFSNQTITYYEADFTKLNKAMLKEFPCSITGEWNLHTEANLFTDWGDAYFRLQLSSNKEVGILDCEFSNPEPQTNFEISLFSTWIRQRGWDTPIVSDFIARENKGFWKYFYLSNIVKGHYLELNILKK